MKTTFCSSLCNQPDNDCQISSVGQLLRPALFLITFRINIAEKKKMRGKKTKTPGERAPRVSFWEGKGPRGYLHLGTLEGGQTAPGHASVHLYKRLLIDKYNFITRLKRVCMCDKFPAPILASHGFLVMIFVNQLIRLFSSLVGKW